MKIFSSLSLAIGFIMITQIFSQDGSTDPNNDNTNNETTNTATDPKSFVCTNQQSDIEIGMNTTVCIHFYPRPFRMAFEVTADEYSVLSMGGAYNFVSEDSLNTQSFVFQIAANNTMYPSLYYNKQDQFIIPVFNIVIKVDNGVIYDVVWDNDCFSCLTSSECYTNTELSYLNDTSITTTEKNCKSNLCALDADNAFNCDPKFYVTWFGTDKNGRELKSSNLSMSRFRQYAVGSLYNSAKDAFNKTMETLKSTWEDVKTTTEDILKSFD